MILEPYMNAEQYLIKLNTQYIIECSVKRFYTRLIMCYFRRFFQIKNEPGAIRTHDHLIKSQVLYQLSYGPNYRRKVKFFLFYRLEIIKLSFYIYFICCNFYTTHILQFPSVVVLLLYTFLLDTKLLNFQFHSVSVRDLTSQRNSFPKYICIHFFIVSQLYENW